MSTSPITEASYDEVPYDRAAIPKSHPDQLATLARLFGMTPPALEHCRVLELGCACGDNLIPMAVTLPHARFVGLDLSQQQIATARAAAAELQLDNIDFRHADIA